MKIYVDGSTNYNGQKGQDSYVIVLTPKLKIERPIGNQTISYAELYAILLGCIHAKDKDEIYSDSQFSVRVCNGEWKIKADHLKDIVSGIKKILKDKQLRLIWISRELNKSHPEED